MSVMSVVSLRRRPLAVTGARAADSPAPASIVEGSAALTLHDLPVGVAAVVVDVRTADPATTRRLLDLGFVPGTPVEMVRRAPLRDPVVYRVAGYEIALRRAQAECIRIDALA